MKILVITTSEFGNTAEIAAHIATGLSPENEVVSTTPEAFDPAMLQDLDLLIAGSPTQKFYPLPSMTALIKSIPREDLDGVRVAAFDTRFTEEEIAKIRILDWMVKIFGYAAPSLLKGLRSRGGTPLSEPMGFYVGDTEGPLLEGETARAREWGASLIKLMD